MRKSCYFMVAEVSKNGVYDEIMGVLKGFDVAEFSAIKANPDFETCLKARDYAK